MCDCPRCKQKINGVTNLRIHVVSCKSNPIEVRVKRSVALPSPVTASEKSNEYSSNNESELRTTQQVDQVPGDIDGLKHYKVRDENTSTILAKSRDGTK